MTYATVSQIRLLSGLSESEVPNSKLTSLIPIADRKVRNRINIKVFNEKLSGTIDGSNTEFRVLNRPISDTNFDTIVDSNEVMVYTIVYNNDTGFEESTEVTVSSVSGRDGIITLSSAPSTSVDFVKVDYSYTIPNIDWEQVKIAASYLTALLSVTEKHGPDIQQYTIDNVRVDKRSVGDRYRREYKEAIQELALPKIMLSDKDERRTRPIQPHKTEWRGVLY